MFKATNIIEKVKVAGNSLHRFLVFLIILLVFCGVFILTTNGLYYWLSRPMAGDFIAAKTKIDSGVPATALSEEDRLSYYQDCAAQLAGLPEQITGLNRQPWTFAVLIRENFGDKAVPDMLDKITRGTTAIQAYFDATDTIRLAVDAFEKSTGNDDESDIAGQRLNECMPWYTSKINEADRLDKLFIDLAAMPDVDLVGSLFTREELGLDRVSARVAPYREPVNDLKQLLTRSDNLEKQLDALYLLNPSSAIATETEALCDQLLSVQNTLESAAALVDKSLPLALQPAFDEWAAGLPQRTRFIQYVKSWWQNSTLMQQSLISAASDRATAHRYLADSLAEPNVDTAYLWTQTAQQFRDSMTTAIDFANIYIDRINASTSGMATSRLTYREAMGLSADVRDLPETDIISAEAFWLQNG